MPAIAPSSPITALVTGANGYIAAHTIRTLLSRSPQWQVVGTVRSASKGIYLTETLFKEATQEGRFRVVVVEDIGLDGAFDEIFKDGDIEVVFHMASPVTYQFEETDDIIVPALKGTTSILASALRYGTSLKRIVLTASTATIITPDAPPPATFDETCWNEASVKEVEEKGKNANPREVYRASKVLAEKAAWKFVEDHKHEIGWDLVVMCPPLVLGPPIHDTTGPSGPLSAINMTMQTFYNNVVLGPTSPSTLNTASNCWVDVRDIAEAEVRAAEREACGGERIVLSGGEYWWQDIVDVAHTITPPPIPNLPLGLPGSTKDKPFEVIYNTSKAYRLLGMGRADSSSTSDNGRRGKVNGMKTLGEMVSDSIEWFATVGGVKEGGRGLLEAK
ncbi:NAD-P-binding protein [Stereum hirsutum FP-91666 SS1]|uniref:NAD-P-binding protein n=1 Tax=Stereum hirsutum (strain FP-91666) TaxID=721885 RepID=UPI00044498BD|nr:NAD-P-binding protein [Stereum hirsutum FP-91666 SS1]EIM85328.1 NAD-P-binding protein [Stereum hirsutum FP-91666 SS1]